MPDEEQVGGNADGQGGDIPGSGDQGSGGQQSDDPGPIGLGTEFRGGDPGRVSRKG
jgi:hypothetical protein